MASASAPKMPPAPQGGVRVRLRTTDLKPMLDYMACFAKGESKAEDCLVSVEPRHPRLLFLPVLVVNVAVATALHVDRRDWHAVEPTAAASAAKKGNGLAANPNRAFHVRLHIASWLRIVGQAVSFRYPTVTVLLLDGGDKTHFWMGPQNQSCYEVQNLELPAGEVPDPESALGHIQARASLRFAVSQLRQLTRFYCGGGNAATKKAGNDVAVCFEFVYRTVKVWSKPAANNKKSKRGSDDDEEAAEEEPPQRELVGTYSVESCLLISGNCPDEAAQVGGKERVRLVTPEQYEERAQQQEKKSGGKRKPDADEDGDRREEEREEQEEEPQQQAVGLPTHEAVLLSGRDQQKRARLQPTRLSSVYLQRTLTFAHRECTHVTVDFTPEGIVIFRFANPTNTAVAYCFVAPRVVDDDDDAMGVAAAGAADSDGDEERRVDDAMLEARARETRAP